MDESNYAFGDIEFVHFDTNNDCEKLKKAYLNESNMPSK